MTKSAETMLDQGNIAYFKVLLENQLHELVQKADITVSALLSDDRYSPDPLDRASSDTAVGMNLRIRDRESKLIRKIKKALEKIEEGDFGICEMCGRNISIQRLKVRPVTTLCIKCKTKMEIIERMRE